uniref:Ribonuclease H protein At1g65750 family n=1 Tax=Cajanus cajan TaxID=3821 RepID=A0A151RWW5_CAJCA|nr:Putative ribonuclease H protein At1g65750 family [Cajanus cajan]
MLGRCSMIEVELWPIFHGLRIIKEKGTYAPILIELDSIIVVKFLNEGCPKENPCYSLVNHVVHMAGDNHNVECVHILWEANQVAYHFAKQGLSILEDILVFNSPPPWEHFVLFANSSNVIYARDF